MNVPTFHGPAARRAGFGLLTATLLVLASATPGHAEALGGLPSMDPEHEAPGSANSSLAEACRQAARARLGGGDYAFGPPVFTTRDGRPMIRMNIRPADQASDPSRLFRVACTPDPATKEIQPVIFDASADRSGPRVIMIQGPDPAITPTPAPPERIVATPSQPEPAYDNVGMDGGYGTPGLFYGYSWWPCWNCRPLVKPVPLTPNKEAILRRQPGIVVHREPNLIIRREPGIVVHKQPDIVVRRAPLIVVRPVAPSSRFVFRFSSGGFAGHGMR